MNPTLAKVISIVLAVAAIVAVPVQTWLAGRPALEGLLGALAALLALFLKRPGTPAVK